MKRFWKKVNRGLLLGALLIVLLLVFVIVKGVQFRAEIPKIRAVAVEGFEELLALNLAMDGQHTGVALTSEQQAEKMQDVEAYLQAYWDFDVKPDEYGWYVTADTLRRAAEAYFANDYVPCMAEEITLNVPDRAVTVTANGTDYAKVSFYADGLTVLLKGDADALFYGSDTYLPTLGSEALSELKNAQAQYVTFETYVDFEMHRVGGEWKILTASISVYANGQYSAKTEVAG